MQHLFQIQFTEFLSDWEAIKLFQTSKSSFLSEYTRYRLKLPYPIQHFLNRTPPIPHELSNIEQMHEIVCFLINCPASWKNLTLRFTKYFNEELDFSKLLCNNIKQIKCNAFGSRYNQFCDNLPTNLTTLKLGHDFNKPLDCLPHSLTELFFDYEFNQYIDKLPSNLLKLRLGYRFNKPVNFLPPNLTEIDFGKEFNQYVVHLPQNLTKLSFGYDFNQCVDYLPQKLVRLRFGKKFNQQVDRLPKNLKQLTFGKEFNQPVLYLPSTLKVIIFGDEFNRPLDRLPSNLLFLTVGEEFNQSLANLPSTLNDFICGLTFDAFPLNLLRDFEQVRNPFNNRFRREVSVVHVKSQ
jgi:hypothetical protein